MNIRQQIATLALVMIIVGGSMSVNWLSADQPEVNQPSHPKTIMQQETAEAVREASPPSATPNESLPNESLKDPLYEAIRDQLNAGRPSLIPSDIQSVIQPPISKDNALSTAEWEAVELILRAARILEQDAARRGTNARATDLHATAQQVRAHALQILRRAITP